MHRTPSVEASSTSASRVSSGGTPSAAGEALQRLPATVPAFWIWIEPTSRAASFSPSNFRTEVIAAWLNFYVMAQQSDEARRLLSVYHRRLRSNLTHDLRPLIGDEARGVAERIGGLIDGLYLRFAINPQDTSGQGAGDHVLAVLNHEIRALT